MKPGERMLPWTQRTTPQTVAETIRSSSPDTARLARNTVRHDTHRHALRDAPRCDVLTRWEARRLSSGVARWGLTCLAVALVVVVLGARGVVFGAARATLIDKSKVYYGDARTSTNPATVRRMKVYDEIPAYRRIKEDGLRPGDAEYHILVAETSRVFRDNLKKVAGARGHDLVAEENAFVTKDAPMADLTPEIIRRVKGEL